jgi:hypothetical protein
MSDDLLDALAASQQLIAAMIRIAADDGSARVGAWNLRDIAAHLAASDREAFEPRIRAIASGSRPNFGLYSNDDTDFSGVQLDDALAEWGETRTRLLDFVRDLKLEQRALVGMHERYGELSVDRYLELALDHDRGHLRDVEKVAGGLGR